MITYFSAKRKSFYGGKTKSIFVNDTMLDLYWNLGKDIVEKQKASHWGDGFLQAMSRDLKKAFPNVSGFSVQNLKSIRYWYKFYNPEENGLQGVSQTGLTEKMVKAFSGGITVVDSLS